MLVPFLRVLLFLSCLASWVHRVFPAPPFFGCEVGWLSAWRGSRIGRADGQLFNLTQCLDRLGGAIRWGGYPYLLSLAPLVRAFGVERHSSGAHCFFFTPLCAFSSHGAEWIKGLLAVPFVLYSQPTGAFDPEAPNVSQATEEAHRRYAEIMRDVEVMLDDHSKSGPLSQPSLGRW